jgi:hypothetical protein
MLSAGHVSDKFVHVSDWCTVGRMIDPEDIQISRPMKLVPSVANLADTIKSLNTTSRGPVYVPSGCRCSESRAAGLCSSLVAWPGVTSTGAVLVLRQEETNSLQYWHGGALHSGDRNDIIETFCCRPRHDHEPIAIEPQGARLPRTTLTSAAT